MSQYEVGQMVRALTNAQGMVKGEVYEVRSASTMRNFLGGYTTYGLTGRSEKVLGADLSVGNGHLVLEAA